MDSDKVMVFEEGKIIEFGEPQELLNNTEGKFYSLAKQAMSVK